jgi:hypothetical protein
LFEVVFELDLREVDREDAEFQFLIVAGVVQHAARFEAFEQAPASLATGGLNGNRIQLGVFDSRLARATSGKP